MEGKRVGIVLGFALLIRLAFVLGYPQAPIVSDALEYDQAARFLAFGQVTPSNNGTIAKGPVYPVLLAIIYRLAGPSPVAVRVVQAVLGTLGVWLLYAIGCRAFDAHVGLTAAGLGAIAPAFIAYTGWLLTETLTVCLTLLFVYLLIGAMQRAKTWWWLAAGVVGGVLVLTRPEMLLVVLVCGVLAGWQGRWRRSAWLLLAAGLTIAPWTARNWAVYHHWVLVAPGDGQFLWMSTYEKDWMSWDEQDPRYRTLASAQDPIELDARMRQEAIRNILTQPLTYAALCLKRIPRFWLGGHSHAIVGLEAPLGRLLSEQEYARSAVKLMMLSFNMAVILLGFAGWYVAWRVGSSDRLLLVLLAAPVAVKALMHVALFAVLRYQIPILGLLMVCAAFALHHGRRVIRDLLPA